MRESEGCMRSWRSAFRKPVGLGIPVNGCNRGGVRQDLLSIPFADLKDGISRLNGSRDVLCCC